MTSMVSRAVGLPLRLVPRGAVMRVMSGPLRGRKWIAGAGTHGCWLGTYERLTQRILRQYVRSGDVVIDAGANAGFFTMLASRLAGPQGLVYAIEPLERNARFIRRHIALNSVANVHVLQLALSDHAGTALFSAERNPSMGHISDGGDVEVELATLDELARSMPSPSLVKMDIEGGEHAALLGGREMLRRARPVILLSEHGWEQHQSCGRLLADLGYDVRLLVDGSADGNYVVLALPR